MTSRKFGKRLYQMTNQHDHGVGRHSGIRGVLYEVFCDMLVSLNMDVMRWSYLLNDYVRKQAPHFQNRRDMTSLRGNLNKEFTRKTMTWKVFCKALMFLQVVRFKLIIEAEYSNGKIVRYVKPVSFGTVDPHLNTEEDEESDGDGTVEELFSSPFPQRPDVPASSNQDTTIAGE